MKTELSREFNFYGTATVGERGQIVIPAEARKSANILPGDKVLVVGHPPNGLMILKMDAMKLFLSSLKDDFAEMESRINEQLDKASE
jgi:AbrB family looped-hinge helix DNA binding protein